MRSYKPKAFSDEQLAGQRLMVGFDGTELDADLKYLIDRLKVGGIILFSRNISGPDQIKRLCVSAQAYAVYCGHPPLLIAIDQEGGQVARLREPFTQFAGNPAMDNESDAARFAHITAKELIAIGINMNMAPVLDVAFDTGRSIMAARAFGPDPDRVAKMGATVIGHLQQMGVMSVAKHFPGIGRTLLDSHLEMPVLDIEFDRMETSDLIPFKAAMDHNVSGIMLSHVLYRQLDSQWPASLSKRIARDLLRDRLGFDGIVLTDDLDMGAVEGRYDIQTMINRILSAHIDVALICHRSPKMESAFEQILQAIKDSPELRNQSVASVERMLKLKRRYLNI